jgi:hypothetical protein
MTPHTVNLILLLGYKVKEVKSGYVVAFPDKTTALVWATCWLDQYAWDHDPDADEWDYERTMIIVETDKISKGFLEIVNIITDVADTQNAPDIFLETQIRTNSQKTLERTVSDAVQKRWPTTEKKKARADEIKAKYNR